MSLRQETLKNRKDFRSKVLKIEKRSKVKEEHNREKNKKQQDHSVSPSKNPVPLDPMLRMSIFYHFCISSHPQLSSVVTELARKLMTAITAVCILL
jgi:hypothetical protein